MQAQPKHVENRWGAWGAMLYRRLIPAGLLGSTPLLLLIGMLVHNIAVLFVSYPLVVLSIAIASVRNVVLSHGPARIIGAVIGLWMTGTAVVLTSGFVIAMGGV